MLHKMSLLQKKLFAHYIAHKDNSLEIFDRRSTEGLPPPTEWTRLYLETSLSYVDRLVLRGPAN